MTRLGLLLWCALSLAGCASLSGAPLPAPGAAEVVWRGEVRVDRDIVFPRGTRLVLEPGTVVRFPFRDDDGDGWGDASLRLPGDLIARGTADAPVVFTSAAEPAEPGQWGEVRVDFGSFDLSYVVLEGSTRGLHAHFCEGRVTDSVVRRNVDGTRLGESAVSVERCLFYGNVGKALNARRCRSRVRDNVFRQNRSGIFLFEGDGSSAFEANLFWRNEAPLRLGDFFEGAVKALGNDWSGSPPEPEPVPGARIEWSQSSVKGAGPRRWPLWEPVWEQPLGGFVDASPVLADEGVYAVSWSGEVRRLGFFDGSVLARAALPDTADAEPALGPGVLAAPCWDRGLHLLRRGDLALLDRFGEEASPADDHRQSTPVFAGSSLFAGTWAGVLRRFDVSGGRLEPRWAFRADGPFRAGLAWADGLVLAPCQDGNLYGLDGESGRPAWTFSAGAPLLSALAVDGRTAYVADREGRLHAVDIRSGELRWRASLGGPAWYAPTLWTEGVVLQGDDSGQLTALEAATGQVLWARQVGAGIRSRPALAGTSIAVATAGGRMLLLDPGSGLERDSIQLSGSLLSSPAAAGNRVFFGGRDGSVHAWEAKVLAP